MLKYTIQSYIFDFLLPLFLSYSQRSILFLMNVFLIFPCIVCMYSNNGCAFHLWNIVEIGLFLTCFLSLLSLFFFFSPLVHMFKFDYPTLSYSLSMFFPISWWINVEHCHVFLFAYFFILLCNSESRSY